MPRATYRPHSINADVSFTGSYGPHVGGDAALDTRDGDTSYVETGRGTTPVYDPEVTFRLEPETAPPPPGAPLLRMTIDMEWRSRDATPGGAGMFNSFATVGDLSGGGTSWATIVSAQTASTSYVWVEDLLAVDMETANSFRQSMVTKLVNQVPGYYWRMFTLTPPTGTFVHGRVTFLRVHVYYEGGGRPLRWRQRNDQFASGAPKAAKGVRTAQGSIAAAARRIV